MMTRESNGQLLKPAVDKTRVQSVQRALQILQMFTQDAPEWGVADLSRRLALSKSIVFRLLMTLQDAGFIEQNQDNQKYRLGRKIMHVAAMYSNENDLVRVGSHYLRELVAQAGVGGLIGILDGSHYMCLLSIPSRSILDIYLRPGDRRPAHATAAGKALLAGLSDEAVRTLFPEEKMEGMTPHTIRDVSQLLAELDTVRRQGYAMNCDESFLGLTAVAAPIRNYRGEVVASIALGWVTHSLAESRIPRLTQLIAQAGEDISRHLGNI